MEINAINGHTRTLGAPANWDQSKGECVGLPIIDTQTEHGPCMISEWQPEADDLKLLNMGMPIHLWVFGQAHPVVSISVGQPTQEAIDKAALDILFNPDWDIKNAHRESLIEAGVLIGNLEAEVKALTTERDQLLQQLADKSPLAIEVQDPWEPIETAIEFDEIIVTGFCFGDPEKGRFFSKAKRYEDRFYSTNEFGEEEEIGFLTHWIYTPDSHHAKIFRKAINPEAA